MSIILISTL